MRFVIVIKTKYIWLHDLNSLKFVHNFLRHVMYRKAISKLIAIEPRSAIMNFIIHTHLSIFKKNLRVLKQFISYLMKMLRHYIRSRIWKKIFHKIKVQIWLLWYFKTKIVVPNRVLYVVFTKRFLRLLKELFNNFVDSIKYMYH